MRFCHRAWLGDQSPLVSARPACSPADLAAKAMGKEFTVPISATTPLAKNCIESAMFLVEMLQTLSLRGLFNSKTWWDVYFVEAASVVLVFGRLLEDAEFDTTQASATR